MKPTYRRQLLVAQRRTESWAKAAVAVVALAFIFFLCVTVFPLVLEGMAR